MKKLVSLILAAVMTAMLLACASAEVVTMNGTVVSICTETITAPLGGRLVETGTIELGPATILSTVSGREAREYRAEVSRLYQDGDGLHAMIVITDSELRDRTGGIVQGMSGSPVLQNGRLVAAVTHVFLADPTRGYAISIQDMLDDAGLEDRAA